ncbi:MAG: hypothetical protein LDL50_06810 [Chloroflexi bacterium]|nr:hypothetical protein [Chloroflexota bacterium]MCA2000965.1 hypothetical protein [Chloroflexota bacterium]
MTLAALLLSVLLSSATLAWGFAQSGFASFSAWMIVFGLGWLLAVWQRWFWYSSLALILYIILAALGLWFGFSPGWLFAGGIFALFAWDMTEFRQRLVLMGKRDDARVVERRHLLRVSLLALTGMTLASIAMLLRGQFTFEWGALFVAVILLGLAQLAGWFRK